MTKIVEYLLTNQWTLFIIGCLLTIVPAMGIMIVHSTEDKNTGH